MLQPEAHGTAVATVAPGVDHAAIAQRLHIPSTDGGSGGSKGSNWASRRASSSGGTWCETLVFTAFTPAGPYRTSVPFMGACATWSGVTVLPSANVQPHT